MSVFMTWASHTHSRSIISVHYSMAHSIHMPGECMGRYHNTAHLAVFHFPSFPQPVTLPSRAVSTSGSCERCVFSWEGRSKVFSNEVFFRMYLPLALEVYNRLFIDSLGFMAVERIKIHVSGTKGQFIILSDIG